MNVCLLQSKIFGIEYKKSNDLSWNKITNVSGYGTNKYFINIPNLEYNTDYNYRAYIKSSVNGFTGNTLNIRISIQSIFNFILFFYFDT